MNDYCVYLHKTKDGVVFYVGSGKKRRAYRKELSRLSGKATYRGKAYSDFVESLNFEYDVEIVCDGLSKKDSILIEMQQYDKYSSTILNVNRPSAEIPLTSEMFSDFLEYDESSPSCLKWKVDRFAKSRKLVSAGDNAGSLNSDSKYWKVRINKVDYYVHRIVAVLNGINVDGKVIDHIDRNPSNNKIENLVVVTQKENMLNKELQAGNSGVPYICYKSIEQRFIAKYKDGDKMRQKSFSVIKYGYDKAFELAKQVIRDNWNFNV